MIKRKSTSYWNRRKPDYRHLDFSDWGKKHTDNNPSKTEDNEHNNQDNETDTTAS